MSDAAQDLGAWAHREKRTVKTIAKGAWEKAKVEARGMITTGDWSAATPRHYVAVYALMHEMVYGAEPIELDSKLRLAAAGMASRMLQEQFGGSNEEMAGFMRWVWTRERERERARTGTVQAFRISWSFMFRGSLLTDYRVAKARARRV